MTLHPTIDIEQDAAFMEIHRAAKGLTLTSIERRWGLYKAIEYVAKNNIQGDIVEAGVWKGGSMLIAAKSLLLHETPKRKLWLYDTFLGMSEPGEHDVPIAGVGADHFYKAGLAQSLDTVRATMAKSGYPPELMRYVVGDVRETLALGYIEAPPERIALLRLDTDWYDSTLAELDALYHLVSRGGVVIFDDYGHWLGQQKAVDEFFRDRCEAPLLHRLDYSGRMMVKP